MNEVNAPVTDPIAHLDFTPTCECRCHMREPAIAVNVVFVHGNCAVQLLCADCTVTKGFALRYLTGSTGAFECPYCHQGCDTFEDLIKVVPL